MYNIYRRVYSGIPSNIQKNISYTGMNITLPKNLHRYDIEHHQLYCWLRCTVMYLNGNFDVTSLRTYSKQDEKKIKVKNFNYYVDPKSTIIYMGFH